MVRGVAVQGRDLTKGRRRDQGAVKISCARQDPNARNCHGYRKFVKRSVLENPANGYLVNDTIIIRYTIELVVSTGGALSRNGQLPAPKPPQITVPPSSMGRVRICRVSGASRNHCGAPSRVAAFGQKSASVYTSVAITLRLKSF